MSNETKHPGKPLEDLRKAHEEEYFRKKDREKVEKMKNRSEMADSGITDKKLADDLAAAGYNADSVRALFIIPLIEVAWVDWTIQSQERDEIMGLLKERGIEKGSDAYNMVSKWLKEKPTDEAFERGLKLIRPVVQSAKKMDANAISWILESCEKVAEATGGLFGTGVGGSMSKHEAEVIERVAKKLSQKG